MTEENYSAHAPVDSLLFCIHHMLNRYKAQDDIFISYDKQVFMIQEREDHPDRPYELEFVKALSYNHVPTEVYQAIEQLWKQDGDNDTEAAEKFDRDAVASLLDYTGELEQDLLSEHRYLRLYSESLL